MGEILQRRQRYCVRKIRELHTRAHCPFSLIPRSDFSIAITFISFVVDLADAERFPSAAKELHELITKQPLAGIPLLVLGNKNDLSQAVSIEDLQDRL